MSLGLRVGGGVCGATTLDFLRRFCSANCF